MQLQTFFSEYRMRDPHDLRPFFPFLACSPHICPFYAPFVRDTNCRFCHKLPQDHRKYFVYSMYARKIQQWYFKQAFKCFIIRNGHLFHKHSVCRPVFVNIKLFYYRYWRNWHECNILPFLRVHG